MSAIKVVCSNSGNALDVVFILKWVNVSKASLKFIFLSNVSMKHPEPLLAQNFSSLRYLLK